MTNKKDKSPVGYNEEMFGESAPVELETPNQSGETADPSKSLLDRQLAPDERLLWWGKPQKLHGPRGTGMVFGVLFLGFSCFWEVMALQIVAFGAGPIGLIFPLFGLPFIFAGMKMLFPGLMSGGRLRDTVYAITDRRALVVTHEQVTAWELDTVQSVEKHYYKDGTGDLVLSNGRVETYYRNGHTRTRNITMEFFGLMDVDAAEAALRDR